VPKRQYVRSALPATIVHQLVLLSVYSYQEEVTPDELIKILASVDRTVAALEKRSGQNYTAVKGATTAKGKKTTTAASAGK
jgi:hypothetical protein